MNLFEALKESYIRMGQWNESVATGGSATTIVDTKLAGEGSDGDWEDGAAFIVYDAGGAGAAPEGEFRRVSAFDAASGTLTVDTAFTAAVDAGDRYGYVSTYFPHEMMIAVVNTALQGLGYIPVVDTSISLVDGASEYDLAVGFKTGVPYRVDVQANTDDADDNQWVESRSWYYVPSTAGSVGKLIFDNPVPYVSGGVLRVWYRTTHPYVQAATDPIYEGFHPELVTRAIVYQMLSWQNARLQGGDEFLLQRENLAMREYRDAQLMFPTWRPPTRSKILTLERGGARYASEVL
jgi:hypothetical protein